MAPPVRDTNYYRTHRGSDDDAASVDLEARQTRQRHYHEDPPAYSVSKQKPIPVRPSPPSTISPPLSSWSTTFLSSKPQPVQERVVKLFYLQHKYTNFMMQYQEEALALERKYQALVQPLYDERKETIIGLRDRCSTPDGIPDFWLNAMNNEPSIAELIAPRDRQILRKLKDIKLESLPNGERGFVLVFTFGQNNVFWNVELRKTYTYTRAADSGPIESAEDIYSSEYTFHESIGDIIHWKDGANLINQKEEDEDGDQVESFFAFFSAPAKPEGEGEEVDEEMRTYEWLLELDFDYGEVFKEKVIPYAVHWYTGEAALYEDVDDDDDDSEADDEDSEKDGSDDDSDDGRSEDSH